MFKNLSDPTGEQAEDPLWVQPAFGGQGQASQGLGPQQEAEEVCRRKSTKNSPVRPGPRLEMMRGGGGGVCTQPWLEGEEREIRLGDAQGMEE